MVFGADQVYTLKASKVSVLVDKNGNEFTRVIAPVQKKIGDREYEDDIVVSFFGNDHKKLQEMGIQEGKMMEIIASEREYNGSQYLQVKDVINVR
jgi:hypothetical protein